MQRENDIRNFPDDPSVGYAWTNDCQERCKVVDRWAPMPDYTAIRVSVTDEEGFALGELTYLRHPDQVSWIRQ